MSAALRPSEFPEAPALRAKYLGKVRNPLRRKAREWGQQSLWKASRNVADEQLGAFAAEREKPVTPQEAKRLAADEGACVRTGATVLTLAEVALLLPIDVAGPAIVDALKEAIVRASLRSDDANKLLRLRLALTHAEALLVTLT
jgi:hypothetical protein